MIRDLSTGGFSKSRRWAIWIPSEYRISGDHVIGWYRTRAAAVASVPAGVNAWAVMRGWFR